MRAPDAHVKPRHNHSNFQSRSRIVHRPVDAWLNLGERLFKIYSLLFILSRLYIFDGLFSSLKQLPTFSMPVAAFPPCVASENEQTASVNPEQWTRVVQKIDFSDLLHRMRHAQQATDINYLLPNKLPAIHHFRFISFNRQFHVASPFSASWLFLSMVFVCSIFVAPAIITCVYVCVIVLWNKSNGKMEHGKWCVNIRITAIVNWKHPKSSCCDNYNYLWTQMMSFVAQSFPETNMTHSNPPKYAKDWFENCFLKNRMKRNSIVQIIIKAGIGFVCGGGPIQWQTDPWQRKVKTRKKTYEETVRRLARRSRYRILPIHWKSSSQPLLVVPMHLGLFRHLLFRCCGSTFEFIFFPFYWYFLQPPGRLTWFFILLNFHELIWNDEQMNKIKKFDLD